MAHVTIEFDTDDTTSITQARILLTAAATATTTPPATEHQEIIPRDVREVLSVLPDSRQEVNTRIVEKLLAHGYLVRAAQSHRKGRVWIYRTTNGRADAYLDPSRAVLLHTHPFRARDLSYADATQNSISVKLARGGKEAEESFWTLLTATVPS